MPSFHNLTLFATIVKTGVNDGTRTHDDRNHNPGLYQLSYAHQSPLRQTTIAEQPANGAPDRTRTCNLRLSLPTMAFATLQAAARPAGLWSGLYLHHLRWGTYSLYGARMKTLTPTSAGGASARFPRYCHRHKALRFHRYSALHFGGCIPTEGSYSRPATGLKGRCSIRLSYGRNRQVAYVTKHFTKLRKRIR